MKIKILKLVKVLSVVLVLIWFIFFLNKKTDLTTADLGRHIKNGQVLVHGNWSERWAVLNTNYYSYTMPEQPFVNHHWLSGILFYAIYSFSGFAGLSVLYLLFGVLTLALFFKLAAEKAGVFFTSFVSIVLTPLLASRTEVRPEILTYFFTAAFFYLLYRFNTGKQKKAVWFLPTLMLLWVNLHIGFVFGFLVLGAFFVESFLKAFVLKRHEARRKTQTIFWVGVVSLLASLLNPHFIKGVLYPLNIFKNYGYLIVENQSIKFLENLNMAAGQNFFLFKAVAVATCASFILAYIFSKKFSLALFLVTLVSGVLAYKGIRHFPSFAFFAFFSLCLNLAELQKSAKRNGIILGPKEAVAIPVMLFVLVLSLNAGFNGIRAKQSVLGLGLLPGTQASAEFFKKEGLSGPIFNDYDIGGYLAYNLPEKVFVDNRPEAYTVDFFENVYKPMQQVPEKWTQFLNEFQFNTIFFSHRDYTPWAQTFLISRVVDEAWAPIYVDGYNIIFLRRTDANKSIIEKYEIPKSNFGIR
ncbi:MAG: hypothetical protein JNN11_05370 [Candidatus Doudnabacteria bacterium]|nr:hypothetical protein [Candidatus Doudnabacteria bacterium]